jgi:hypothetical protein
MTAKDDVFLQETLYWESLADRWHALRERGLVKWEVGMRCTLQLKGFLAGTQDSLVVSVEKVELLTEEMKTLVHLHNFRLHNFRPEGGRDRALAHELKPDLKNETTLGVLISQARAHFPKHSFIIGQSDEDEPYAWVQVANEAGMSLEIDRDTLAEALISVLETLKD